MRALLYADWCTIRGAVRNYLVPALAIAGVAVLTGLSGIDGTPGALADHIHSVAVSCGILMLTFFGLFGLFGSDEREGWEAVRLSLPLTRREVVRSHYVALVLWFGVVAVVVNLLGAAAGVAASLAAYGRPALANAGDMALLNAIILVVYLLYLAIETPIFFRKGLAAARMYFSLPFMACMLFTLDPVRDMADSLLAHARGLASAVGSPLPLLAGALVVAAGAYGASMLLSERIYAHRDF